MSTTTFASIRDQQVITIRAITPTRRAAKKFELYPGEAEFSQWCELNPQACFRIFEISSPLDAIRPLVSNTDIVDTEQSMNVEIGYPLDYGEVGANNQRELEDLIDEDKWRVDQAIGLHGSPNYVDGQHMAELENSFLLRVEQIQVLALEYRVVFRRQAS